MCAVTISLFYYFYSFSKLINVTKYPILFYFIQTVNDRGNRTISMFKKVFMKKRQFMVASLCILFATVLDEPFIIKQQHMKQKYKNMFFEQT